MNIAEQNYKNLLLHLRSELRPLGFMGSGPNYRRKLPDLMHLVGIQRSDACTPDRLKFTLNIGIWSKDVSRRRILSEEYPGSIRGCHALPRIGEFSPSGQDLWWDVYNENDLLKAYAEIDGLLLHMVIPSLDRLTSAELLLAEWTRDGSILRPESYEYDRFVEILSEEVEAKHK